MFAKGATLRKAARHCRGPPLSVTALFWGPIANIVSNWGGRKDLSRLEIHPKVVVTDIYSAPQGSGFLGITWRG